jgi:hypothetical protein
MTRAQTHDRGGFSRQILLVPAVVMALLTAAAPASASRVTASARSANSARTEAVAKPPIQARSHRSVRFQQFGRKVG